MPLNPSYADGKYEMLNKYLQRLNIIILELAKVPEIFASVISRYRGAELTPVSGGRSLTCFFVSGAKTGNLASIAQNRVWDLGKATVYE